MPEAGVGEMGKKRVVDKHSAAGRGDLNAEINLIADKLDAALDAAATTMDDHGQYR